MEYSTIYHCLHFLSTCHHIIIIEDIMDPSSSCLHYLSVVSKQYHSMEHTHCIFNQVTLLCTEGHQHIIKNFVMRGVCLSLHTHHCRRFLLCVHTVHTHHHQPIHQLSTSYMHLYECSYIQHCRVTCI